MIKARQLRTGNFIIYEKHKFMVEKTEVYSPDVEKILVKLKLFNLDTGETVNVTLPSEIELEELPLTSVRMKFIYKSETSLVFLDEENNEQLEIHPSKLGSGVSFLQDKTIVNVYDYRGMSVFVEMPKTAVFEIDSTEDTEKDSSILDYIKDGRLSNGSVIKVPAFIKTGDKVRIHTETGEYICRE